MSIKTSIHVVVWNTFIIKIMYNISLVLIDAIVKNGGPVPPEEERTFTPPPGWRNSKLSENGSALHQRPNLHERGEGSGDDKKSYTEEQRQGVLR